MIVEAVLFPEDLDTEAYTFQIRRLAARYQTGEDLDKIKKLVDGIITSVEADLKYHYRHHYHLNMWSELFENLNAYTTKFSDPDWMTVIAYARRQVSRKKGAAKARRK